MTEKEKEDRENYISLREYIDQLLSAKGVLCDRLMEGIEARFDLRFCAMEKATRTAFGSSEKAIEKAEAAQRDYNIRSNEFRGQLDDQAKKLMPREETHILVNSVRELQANNWKTSEERLEALRREMERLRETSTRQTGASAGHRESWAWLTGAVALVVSLGTILIILLKLVKL